MRFPSIAIAALGGLACPSQTCNAETDLVTFLSPAKRFIARDFHSTGAYDSTSKILNARVAVAGGKASYGVEEEHHRVLQTLLVGNWTQVGGDIDGEALGDEFGSSVALSSDGTIVAIGAPYNNGIAPDAGHVRVYQWGGSNWTQVGRDIDGGALGDYFGSSVSLSSDGTIVAIGAPYNNGIASDAGHVRVYQWDRSNWTQVGGDIDGEASGDYFGSSVALSSDGTIVAIGAPYNDVTGYNAGLVRVYRWDGLKWTQVGGDIGGEALWDQFGSSVALSSNGAIVAIGAKWNDGNGSNSGHVRVYKRDGSSNWTQLGGDIDGELADDRSGYSVSLSFDGTIVAIGAPLNDGNGSNSGQVRVYRWGGSNWIQLGADIDGEVVEGGDSAAGWSVSLSSDGTIVAIGAKWNDGTGFNAGSVRVYQWDGSNWIQLGLDIDGEALEDYFGSSVSLSFNGTIVAIGAPGNDGIGNSAGHVRIFKVTPNEPPKIFHQLVGNAITSNCSIFINETPLSLKCTATPDSEVIGAMLMTSLQVGACSAVVGNSPGTVEGPEKIISLAPNKTCKNIGICMFHHCFRADYTINGTSVLAYKAVITSFLTYENDGSFSVRVDITEFNATDTYTNATVASTVTASLGACGSHSSGGTAIDIGETVGICVSAQENVTLSLTSSTDSN